MIKIQTVTTIIKIKQNNKDHFYPLYRTEEYLKRLNNSVQVYKMFYEINKIKMKFLIKNKIYRKEKVHKPMRKKIFSNI